MLIRFSAWLPDQPRYRNPCIVARNVRPKTNGYGPFPKPRVITDALPSEPVGAYSFKRVGGTREEFAGTDSKLFRKSGTSWTDVSLAGDYSSSPQWRFALYGSRLVATNGVDNPQKFDLGTDTDFSDLAGAPIHTYPIVIRDVLVAVDVEDGSSFEIKWSGVNDSEKWTADCGGGSQNVPDGGPVVGGTGGEFGIILQEFGLTRMNFVGGDLRFTFDKIEGAIGCISADSIVQHKGRTFYLSDEGFQVFGGSESQNISDEQCTDFFFDAVELDNISDVRGALDPRNSMAIWRYPTDGASKFIGFDYRLGQWSESDADVKVLHTAVTSDGEVLAGFDTNNRLVYFDGDPMPATLETGEMQLARDRSAFVRAVRGLVDGAHDVSVTSKNGLLEDEKSVSGSASAHGKVSLRSEGAYHRFILEPTSDWSEAVGVDVDAVPAGRRRA